MTEERFRTPEAAAVACIATIIGSWRRGQMTDHDAYRAIAAYVHDADRVEIDNSSPPAAILTPYERNLWKR